MKIRVTVMVIAIAISIGSFTSTTYAAVNSQANSSLNKVSANQAKTSQHVIFAGNKYCPVTGEKIVKKYAKQCNYKGKVYYFCTKSCVTKFKKNPGKFIKKLNKMTTENKK